MKRILKSKKGVSLLEGLIALMLLAIVATGTFGVLLSTSRKSSAPDMREEMALAVDRAQQMLQVYVNANQTNISSDFGDTYATQISSGLCGDDTTPLAVGEHEINCLLPHQCDVKNSGFIYKVSEVANAALRPRTTDLAKKKKEDGTDDAVVNNAATTEIQVEFLISCNGYTL
ncbi:MAG: prepilin-type N-terminal cleavage/methylation domain-containing protein [Elusimicrobiaceae bacterium]|nr:prepilin-type N-terminal cleavage/methylation domain-containing protein [Elusimicrobiaceae bacterium]